jgi:hypothetical protein
MFSILDRHFADFFNTIEAKRTLGKNPKVLDRPEADIGNGVKWRVSPLA